MKKLHRGVGLALVPSTLVALALTLASPVLAGETVSPIEAPTSAPEAQQQAQQMLAKIRDARSQLKTLLDLEKPELDPAGSEQWDRHSAWVETVRHRLGELGREVQEAPLLQPGATGSEEEIVAAMVQFNERYLDLRNKAHAEGEEDSVWAKAVKKHHATAMSILRNL